MTIASNDLALTIINDGKGYDDRCRTARLAAYPDSRASNSARRWLDITITGACAYDKQFRSPGESSFSVEDLLLAAVELAEYYAQHITETPRKEGSEQ